MHQTQLKKIYYDNNEKKNQDIHQIRADSKSQAFSASENRSVDALCVDICSEMEQSLPEQ